MQAGYRYFISVEGRRITGRTLALVKEDGTHNSRRPILITRDDNDVIQKYGLRNCTWTGKFVVPQLPLEFKTDKKAALADGVDTVEFMITGGPPDLKEVNIKIGNEKGTCTLNEVHTITWDRVGSIWVELDEPEMRAESLRLNFYLEEEDEL